MAKAIPLTSEALRAPQITPQAATPARSAWAPASTAAATTPGDDTTASAAPGTTAKYGGNQPKPEQVPLQLRIPREAARAIKVAAAQREMTISDFMLMCFATQMQSDSAP